MSLTQYNLHWSDTLIKRVELRLRQVHACLEVFYEKNNYSFTTRTATTALETKEGREKKGNEEEDVAVGPINSVGSFLLRTCVHSSPFYETKQKEGVGADIVLKVPEEICSLKDIHDGNYLARRHNFLLKVEKFLKKHNEHTNTKVKKNKYDENSEEEREKEPIVQWEVQRVPFGGVKCSMNTGKEILRIYFLKSKQETMRRELFHIDVHFQPFMLPGRIASALAIRKHPLYSYLVLEDALMTSYMRKLHALYTRNHSLLRATVLLKCWAHHVGLMSLTSGHQEALGGFHMAAIVLHLFEAGVILPSMSEENAVRSVWVHMVRGMTHQNNGNYNNSDVNGMAISVAEESGEVAVLRLAGETMNIFFRISGAFFQHVIKKAAEEALQLPHSAEIFQKTLFKPLQLRLDVCLVVKGLTHYFAEADQSPIGKSSGAALTPSAQKVKELQELIQEALGARSSYAAIWRLNEDAVHVAVELTNEGKARNRITRGPAIEDSDAVERFNTFWGADVTSTRQFADGGIYRCVLWSFDEDISFQTNTELPVAVVIRRVVEFALKKHISSGVHVSQLLGDVENMLAEHIGEEWRDAAPFAQKLMMEACRDVEAIIVNIPRSVLPCKIISVDIIAPSERQTAMFPVRPHLALTYTTDDITQPCFLGLSTTLTIEPIYGVLTIEDNGKIPDTTEAITIIKGAICAQLSRFLQETYGDKSDKNGVVFAKKSAFKNDGMNEDQQQEKDHNWRKFCVRTSCTTDSLDIIYKGYLFRFYPAHYREVLLLKTLQRNAEAAMIERKLFWSVKHAKFLRTIVFGHHSYSMATRIAKRWLSAMLLLEFILPEAVELLVANIYLGQNPPKTAVGGFLQFLGLLATHDWSKPLVLPYSLDSKLEAEAASLVRTMGEQQGMFIATPYAPMESPFTTHTPRPMIMHRVVSLAESALAKLVARLSSPMDLWSCVKAIFTPSSNAFDFYMPFHSHFLLQPDRLVTPQFLGQDVSAGGAVSTSPLRIWQLDELEEDKSRLYIAEFVEREPAADVVRKVRATARNRCMVFYDSFAPSGIYVITVTPSPTREICKKLHDDILYVARGALLPASCMPAGASSGAKTTAKKTVKNAQSAKFKKGTTSVITEDKVAADYVPEKSAGKDGGESGRRKRIREENEDKYSEPTKSSFSGKAKRLKSPLKLERKNETKLQAEKISTAKRAKNKV